ncbi:bifunctional NAD(P)/FAD-dependent oxidoreductase/class I SAM-dependent methyltransferase [Salinibacterium amurskyense]|uniref:bifunctional NAD(P)/FAD-dependent oxidoreductase/class I SAM-dependent methyltransferase n=1 Tax=Salinibacterium amurskyense TaxID=205941 RepID=UPI00311F6367
MENTHWDVVVIGAGPAGLSAALLLGRARRRTLVVDAGEPRNRFAAHMHGVLGHEGSSPQQLRHTGEAELGLYGVEVVAGAVDRLDDVNDGVRVALQDGSVLTTRAVVVATGITDVLAEIPGLAERWGSSVIHCPYCHGWEIRDSALGVLATEFVGLHQAFLARQWSDNVTVFTAGVGDVPEETVARLRSRGVKLIDSPVVELAGEADGPIAIHTADGAVTPINAMFTAGTPRPHDSFLTDLRLARAEIAGVSMVAVDAAGKTSHDRIWAAGNVVNPMLTVPMSIGAGAMAGAAVNGMLVVEDFDLAERTLTPTEFWEQRYAHNTQVWSGHANAVLADVVGSIEQRLAAETPGGALGQRTAIDLGCGEGGDALWLAARGWKTTGVDISRTALERAQVAANAAQLSSDQLRFVVADLSDFEPEDSFDLVTASFLQSPVRLDRAEILRAASRMVAPGGHLLVTAHATSPFSGNGGEGEGHDHDHDHDQARTTSFEADFPTPDEELENLHLDPAEWTVALKELRPRTITRPDADPFTIEDSVVLVRRS